MNTFITLLVARLLLVAVPAVAADAPGLEGLAQSAQESDERSAAHKLEVAGGVLTGVGVLTQVATLALWSTSHLCIDGCSRTPAEQRRDDQQFAAAVATSVIAPVLMIAGITTWAVGANRRKTIDRKNRAQPTLTLTAGGVTGQF